MTIFNVVHCAYLHRCIVNFFRAWMQQNVHYPAEDTSSFSQSKIDHFIWLLLYISEYKFYYLLTPICQKLSLL